LNPGSFLVHILASVLSECSYSKGINFNISGQETQCPIKSLRRPAIWNDGEASCSDNRHYGNHIGQSQATYQRLQPITSQRLKQSVQQIALSKKWFEQSTLYNTTNFTGKYNKLYNHYINAHKSSL